MDLICQYCGNVIVPKGIGRPPTKFCSRECKGKHLQWSRRQAALAKLGERRCAICDVILPGHIMVDAKCCSPECRVTYKNRVRAVAKRKRMLAERKPCKQCGEPIPEDRRSGAVFCSPKCKQRGQAQAKTRWHERNPHYMRQYLYGITAERYEAMLAAQDGRCAICRSAEWPAAKDPGRPRVDHDHVTKRVRALLCDFCNRGLGNFGEDPARLRAAAAYLEAVTAS